MSNVVFKQLLTFLTKLEQEKISYSLAHHRDEAVMVMVAVPGERWEVEFLSDGSVEVEKFVSQGDIAGEAALHELFVRFSESGDAVNVPQGGGSSAANAAAVAGAIAFTRPRSVPQ